MKTLTDLSYIWNQSLVVMYLPEFSQWRAYFLYGYVHGDNTTERPFGWGKTPDEALKSYSKMIRGKSISFDAKQVYQVPETLIA